MSFNIGLSGLNAAQKQLDVTGNNIANVNTTGFKSSRAEFEDVYSATKLGVSSKTIGNGVRLANVSQNFGNGGMNVTGNALDMGIQGNGFFTLSDNGSLMYTRAGTFKTDKDGYITNSDGTARLQGFAADSNGNIIPGVLTDLRIDVSNLPPQTTTTIGATINLDSKSAVINQTTTPFDPTNTASYTTPFSSDIYDTQGNKHSLDQYMVKTGANTWNVYTLIDGRNPNGTAPTSPPTGLATDPTPVQMVFDSSGKLQSIGGVTGATTIPVKNWVPGTVTNGVWAANGAGSNDPTGKGITTDWSKTTQFNADTSRAAIIGDGYATGQITDISIDGTGIIFANFSNNQHKPIGQVAVASFTNEQGLQPAGGTNWKQTFASGQPAYDGGEVGTNGSIVSGSLEGSNVDLTSELVDLIKGQSYYQANAKTISTQSTIMQTIIQMT
ncbi:flagellar hook protein FlgE [Pseudomonas vanderleydeniana]|uniref:Flagellar hook protein FlgE n=1 Tax=Pseudomonas vanderleydeniana TaxID=2745495 RepID=A0A9E6PJE2_9PSED|nr:flagellar hook protein FlgE [Pseudomonas vanderleydeniana]QXI27310.1 flagellar hook protein FlgE [Pseudomonas vanderleydeniana]